MSSNPLADIESVSGRGRLVVELSDEGGRGLPRPPSCEGAGAAHAADSFLNLELFRRAVREARQSQGFDRVTLTGGGPSLHPDCAGVVESAAAEGLKVGLILDGEQFDSVWAAVATRLGALTHVCFRLEGATAEAHDGRRGAGSFRNLVRAFSRCRAAGLPFCFVFEVRRETLAHLERAALFAARLGAAGLTFRLAEPPAENVEGFGREAATRETSLGESERSAAEEEVSALARVLRMPLNLSAGCEGADGFGDCRSGGGAGHHVDHAGRSRPCRAAPSGAPAEGPAGVGRGAFQK